MIPSDKLPDLLQENLKAIFVGTAASTVSADAGHYYAHPGNRFWNTLYEVGITPRQFKPSEYQQLRLLGIGLTDLCKIDAGSDHQLASEQFDVDSFRQKIRRYRPKSIAFTSKKAASVFLGCRTHQISLGRQPASATGFPEIFVLTSTSGAASGHWSAAPWHELAHWIKM
jgi:TDG/mug DNA glycosylase family protein